MPDVFKADTIKLMASDALDYYVDQIGDQIEYTFQDFGRRPDERDLANIADLIIERSDRKLPNETEFGKALQRAIVDSGLIDGIEDDLKEQREFARCPAHYIG